MMMANSIDRWERKFSGTIGSCLAPRADNYAGVLLPAIPKRAEWEEFCGTVRAEWPKWKDHLNVSPACLVMLFCGLAFFEYEDGRFWPEFSRVVGGRPRQDEINKAFEHCALHFGLRVRRRLTDTDYVGSAIYFAGIPVAVWGDFLPICHWALWNQGWEHTSDDQWRNEMDRRCGGHVRLKRFLVDNRQLATTFLCKMIAVRRLLSEKPESAASGLPANDLIRREYLEEVPETAEFLSPKDPERLTQDRVSVAFDRSRECIDLRVPAVDQAKLPADWNVGNIKKAAGRYPDKIALNSTIFQRRVPIRLTTPADEIVRLVPGLAPWGLFDLDDEGAMVNPKRESLPVRRYALISRTRIDKIERKGFYEEGFPPNDPFALSDGTQCFITYLEPRDERAERVSISFCSGEGTPVNIRFRPREQIEYHFLPTGGQGSACCRREGGIFFTQSLPTLCIAVPSNFLGGVNTIEELNRKFEVKVIDKHASGKWQEFRISGADRGYYRWEWDSERPVVEKRTPEKVVMTSLQDLKGCYDIPDLFAGLTISVESPEVRREWKVKREKRRPYAEHAWSDLPGGFLLMLLLSQCEDGMTWEQLLLARNAILPGNRMERAVLYRYQRYGFVEQRGAKWRIIRSMATMENRPEEKVQVDYCGDSGKLWSLYCRLNDTGFAHSLPSVGVVAQGTGWPPFLRMFWEARLREKVESCLREYEVVIGDKLWTHC
jgi:hypothetical protein